MADFNLSVTASDLNAAIAKANAAAPQSTTYTKNQVDTALASKASLVAGKVPASELPSYVDDTIEGYYYDGNFYEDSEHTTVITGERGKIYIDLTANKSYRWTGTVYVRVDECPAFGETQGTIYEGNKGKANADAIAAIKDGTNIDSFADVETALSAKADKSIVGLKLVAYNTMTSSSAFTYAMDKNDFIETSPDLARSIGTYIISIMTWSTTPNYSLYAVSYTGGSFQYTSIVKIAGDDRQIAVENGVISVSGLPSAGGKISIHALQ